MMITIKRKLEDLGARWFNRKFWRYNVWFDHTQGLWLIEDWSVVPHRPIAKIWLHRGLRSWLAARGPK